MTGLLVSVRDAIEALDALEGGASLIDVKEPNRGALGPADRQTIECIVRAIGGRVPVSIALGELLDEKPSFDRQDLPAGISFAKVGLSGCLDQPDWTDSLAAMIDRWPPSVTPVAVAYADPQIARSPGVDEVIDMAVRVGCPLLLIDTFGKQSGDLMECMGADRLREICKKARSCQLGLALAGSLDAKTIGKLADICPDWFAVRGAVCVGHRTSRIDRSRVSDLSKCIESLQSATASGHIAQGSNWICKNT